MIIMEKVAIMSLGERLKAYRSMHGLSQAALSRESGVQSAYICRIENDEAPKVPAHVLQKLAKVLGVTTSHLLGEVGFLATFDRPDGE